MRSTPPHGAGRPGHHPAPVAGSLGAAVGRLHGVCPGAATLFRACVFLGPEDIPVWLFEGGDELPAPLVVDPQARAEAFAALCRSPLARWTSPDGISLDPAVQAGGRELLGNERRGWAAGAVRLVTAAFPGEGDDPNVVTTEARRARLVPHALAVAGHEEAAETEPLATTWLLDRVAAHAQDDGRVADARRLLERSLTVARAAYGARHPIVGQGLARIALLDQDIGEFVAARRGFEQALAVGESAYGPEHPEVGAHLANLAVVLQDLGELAGARGCLERALHIARGVDGPEGPAVASVLNNLGSVLGDLGHFTEARQCFEQALVIGDATLGAEHPAVLSIRANQAQLMRMPGAGR